MNADHRTGRPVSAWRLALRALRHDDLLAGAGPDGDVGPPRGQDTPAARRMCNVILGSRLG